jgi:pyrimidine-nucleoside phosphorylase/thymidine phosphorylase
LISASIMSKKLAEGIDGLVLDVKTGDGAFMQRLEDSQRLAQSMVAIGRGLGKDVVALVTRMDQPLGRAVGNAVEIAECVACLKGGGPGDLVGLSVELAAEMVLLAGIEDTMEAARDRCLRAIADGSACERFRMVVQAQGGDVGPLDDPTKWPGPAEMVEVYAARSGVVEGLRARPIGHATMLLGAGRARMDSAIDHAVGLVLHKKLGDTVDSGEALATLLVNDATDLGEARGLVAGAYTIGDGPVKVPDMIVERIAG